MVSSTTVWPHCASNRAALAAAGPPPMMATSKTSLDLENIGDLLFYCIVARYV